MFDSLKAFHAKTLLDAQASLQEHILHNLDMAAVDAWKHSHDFDLYLPWFLELIENHRPDASHDHLPITELQHLYMDAAWDLVMHGTLRPGPRTISADAGGNSYGKGYSLTGVGRHQLSARARTG